MRERGEAGVCVFQYSPDQPVILHRVRTEVIAMREMEATSVSASMATEASTAKKVHLPSLLTFRPCMLTR